MTHYKLVTDGKNNIPYTFIFGMVVLFGFLYYNTINNSINDKNDNSIKINNIL